MKGASIPISKRDEGKLSPSILGTSSCLDRRSGLILVLSICYFCPGLENRYRGTVYATMRELPKPTALRAILFSTVSTREHATRIMLWRGISYGMKSQVR